MRKIVLLIDDYQELVAAENLLRRLGFDVLSLGKEVLLNDALLRFHPDIVIANCRGRSVDGFRVAARVKKLSPPPRVALTYTPNNAPSLSADMEAMIDALLISPLQAPMVIKVVAQMANLDPGPLLGKYQKLTANRLVETEHSGSAGTSAATGGGQDKDSQFVKGGQAESTSSQNVSGQVSPGQSVSSKNTPSQNAPSQNVSSQSVKSKAQSGGDLDPWSKEEPSWDPQTKRGQAATIRTQRTDRYDSFLSDHAEPTDRVVSREKMAAASRKLKRDTESERDALAKIDEEKRAFVKALFEPDDE